MNQNTLDNPEKLSEGKPYKFHDLIAVNISNDAPVIHYINYSIEGVLYPDNTFLITSFELPENIYSSSYYHVDKLPSALTDLDTFNMPPGWKVPPKVRDYSFFEFVLSQKGDTIQAKFQATLDLIKTLCEDRIRRYVDARFDLSHNDIQLRYGPLAKKVFQDPGRTTSSLEFELGQKDAAKKTQEDNTTFTDSINAIFKRGISRVEGSEAEKAAARERAKRPAAYIIGAVAAAAMAVIGVQASKSDVVRKIAEPVLYTLGHGKLTPSPPSGIITAPPRILIFNSLSKNEWIEEAYSHPEFVFANRKYIEKETYATEVFSILFRTHPAEAFKEFDYFSHRTDRGKLLRNLNMESAFQYFHVYSFLPEASDIIKGYINYNDNKPPSYLFVCISNNPELIQYAFERHPDAPDDIIRNYSSYIFNISRGLRVPMQVIKASKLLEAAVAKSQHNMIPGKYLDPKIFIEYKEKGIYVVQDSSAFSHIIKSLSLERQKEWRPLFE